MLSKKGLLISLILFSIMLAIIIFFPTKKGDTKMSDHQLKDSIVLYQHKIDSLQKKYK